MSQVSPRLIYLSLSAYGQTGPWSHTADHDLTAMALSGILDALAPEMPVPGVPIVDFAAAMQAVLAILLALRARERNGCGQYVDVSMLESALPLLAVPLADEATVGRADDQGLLRGRFACYHVYRCSDGRRFAVAALEPKFWQALCGALNLDHLIPEQFRPEKQQEVIRELSACFEQRPAADWAAMLQGVDTCVSVVQSAAEYLRSDQASERETFLRPAHGAAQHAVVPTLGGTTSKQGDRAPRLGQHTREVMSVLGYSEGNIRPFAENGVVQVQD